MKPLPLLLLCLLPACRADELTIYGEKGTTDYDVPRWGEAENRTLGVGLTWYLQRPQESVRGNHKTPARSVEVVVPEETPREAPEPCKPLVDVPTPDAPVHDSDVLLEGLTALGGLLSLLLAYVYRDYLGRATRRVLKRG